ncbi:YiiX/YebB-like N1pC/P60 family cysteine hydrolase [Dokdonella sp.]|uniref:YiiX/YebB-like N1pC/P60 family cysteine hydrolase n=1 Tax=Dokdonella sp. TaxID=2291710 RepID=UPI0025BB83FF|nr:YiiX/YebB-like N1pC/P60 family cysteine hydrolase [Dokdonella sp.]MBX3689178.1 lipo-like protein [Dokdonella sp.]
MSLPRWLGRKLAGFLARPRDRLSITTSRPGLLAATLRKGDVLLVEGTSRFAGAIRYITQSTWSHSALYVGDALADRFGGETMLVEADVNDGVRAVPVSRYAHVHTRICRPVGLHEEEIESVIGYAIARLGQRYDLRNIFDLARYLITEPPVPERYRRRLLALGGGDPTRAICSSLIAAAFESVRYPILPDIEVSWEETAMGQRYARQILHIRDSRLFAPRDFDVSPYFRIIKPTLEHGFDPHLLTWAKAAAPVDSGSAMK